MAYRHRRGRAVTVYDEAATFEDSVGQEPEVTYLRWKRISDRLILNKTLAIRS